jgi:hypothetical protein
VLPQNTTSDSVVERVPNCVRRHGSATRSLILVDRAAGSDVKRGAASSFDGKRPRPSWDSVSTASPSKHHRPNLHSNEDPNPNGDPKRRHIIRDDANPNPHSNRDPNLHSNGDHPNLHSSLGPNLGPHLDPNRHSNLGSHLHR